MLFGLSIFIIGLLLFLKNKNDVIGLVLWLYGVLLGLMLGAFGVSFLIGGFPTMSYNIPISKRVAFKRMIDTFGDKWYEKLIPIQKHLSQYAWPEVSWQYEIKEQPLL